MTEETLTELKACFLEAYDDNKDGKIDIREVSQIIVQGAQRKLHSEIWFRDISDKQH